MIRKHESIASMFAGVSVTIWYDSTVVDVTINTGQFPLVHSPFVASHHHSERGFLRIYMVAYVRLERASTSARLVEGRARSTPWTTSQPTGVAR